jgi:hypothetical protein
VNAPLSVILVPVPAAPGRGDSGVHKKFDYRRHKAIRPAEPWRPQRAIPAGDRNELRRRAQEWREAVRPQAQAMIIEARLRIAA